MKQFMEKVSILSLSLVLTTAFSISSALPAMFDFYQGYSKEQVEMLVSLPSFGIMMMLLLNGVLERIFSERLQLTLGLLLLSICGVAPAFVQAYPIVGFTRFLFGMGLGMINAKAISIISERYEGKTRIQMLGYRGSAEVVGTAILTLGVGQLLALGWTTSFFVYGAGFLVLLLYLFFVPYQKQEKHSKEHHKKRSLTKEMKILILLLAMEAAVVVCTNIAITLRVPSLMIARAIGTPQMSSFVLSVMQLTGILAGLGFSFFFGLFREKLLLFSGFAFGVGQVLIGLSDSLWLILLSTVVSGFAYSTTLTTVFQVLSASIPSKLLNQATSLAVLGCSLGASITPFVLSGVGLLTQDGGWTFAILGIWMMVTSCLVSLILHKKIGE